MSSIEIDRFINRVEEYLRYDAVHCAVLKKAAGVSPHGLGVMGDDGRATFNPLRARAALDALENKSVRDALDEAWKTKMDAMEEARRIGRSMVETFVGANIDAREIIRVLNCFRAHGGGAPFLHTFWEQIKPSLQQSAIQLGTRGASDGGGDDPGLSEIQQDIVETIRSSPGLKSAEQIAKASQIYKVADSRFREAVANLKRMKIIDKGSAGYFVIKKS
jgi:hypothetical protein